MDLRITCEGSGLIDYKTVKNLQGNLKTRTLDDIEGMIKSIILFGVSFPLFIYKHKDADYTIDGHGRLLALAMLEENGYRVDENGDLKCDSEPWTIPPIPCDYIEAGSLAEAKVKLLKHNSEFGAITQAGFTDFTKDMNVKEYTGIPLRIRETENFGDIEAIVNIGDIIPKDVDVDTAEEAGAAAEPESDFEPTLDPTIDTSPVTSEDIEKAAAKEKDKHELETETMQLTCKKCGKELTIRKADIVFMINQKIKELQNARN